MAKNKNLKQAKKAKADEFYTQLSDIEKELVYYKDYFKGKTVFCNCDDPEWSNFWKYFYLNFNHLGLKKLVTTHYLEEDKTYKLECDGEMDEFGKLKTIKTYLSENGDFRSLECIDILKNSDVIVTNPPFSLFRDYVSQLISYKKDFIILGNLNAITYKEIFTLIKKNLLWIGPSISSGDREFRVPNNYPLTAASSRIDSQGNKYVRVKGVRWYTNINHKKRNEEIILFKKYIGNESHYPKYDNYDAINIDKTKEIPIDYDGYMGVPITFLDKYNPDQFEIIGQGQGDLYRELTSFGLNKDFVDNYYFNGGKGSIKENHPVLGYYKKNVATIPYMRIIIRNKNPAKESDNENNIK